MALNMYSRGGQNPAHESIQHGPFGDILVASMTLIHFFFNTITAYNNT